MNNQPPCIEWADKIGLRHEDLSPQEQASLNEHIQTCEFCRNALHDYNFLAERIHALPPPTVKPLPRLSLQLDKQEYPPEVIEKSPIGHHTTSRHQLPERILITLMACAI